MNIYVGNLSYDTSESALQIAFASYGSISAARVATDRVTGRPRGFGFVEMANQAEAQAAIQGLNGSELQGRTLTVNQAKPREGRGASGGDRVAYTSVGGIWHGTTGGSDVSFQAAFERDIVALVSAVRSNRTIVELCVRERPLETHVSSVSAKLGSASRAKVAAWAVENHPLAR